MKKYHSILRQHLVDSWSRRCPIYTIWINLEGDEVSHVVILLITWFGLTCVMRSFANCQQLFFLWTSKLHFTVFIRQGLSMLLSMPLDSFAQCTALVSILSKSTRSLSMRPQMLPSRTFHLTHSHSSEMLFGLLDFRLMGLMKCPSPHEEPALVIPAVMLPSISSWPSFSKMSPPRCVSLRPAGWATLLPSLTLRPLAPCLLYPSFAWAEVAYVDDLALLLNAHCNDQLIRGLDFIFGAC